MAAMKMIKRAKFSIFGITPFYRKNRFIVFKRENQTLEPLYRPVTSLRKVISSGGQLGLLTSLDVIYWNRTFQFY